MTREEAIEHLKYLEAVRSGEHDVFESEKAQGRKELRQALRTLGVTDLEVEGL